MALFFAVQVGKRLILRIFCCCCELVVEALAVGLGEILHQRISCGHESLQAGTLCGAEGVHGNDSALGALVIFLVLLPESLDFFLRSGGGGGQSVLGEPGGLAAKLLVLNVYQVAGVLVLHLETIGHQVTDGFPHHHVCNHAAESFFLLVIGRTVAEAGQTLVKLLVKAAIGLLENRHSLQVGVNLLLGGGDAHLLSLLLNHGAVHGNVYSAVVSEAVAPALVNAAQELHEAVIFRMLGSPGLQSGHFCFVELLVFVLVEHIAHLGAGRVVQGLHIALTILTQGGCFRIGITGAIHLNVVVLYKHAATITVVHHQQAKTYAGHHDEYEK